MRKFYTIAVLLTFCVGANGWSQGAKKSAQPKKQSLLNQFSGQGYGLAGCGLGSIVFGAQPGLVQVPSATTNGIFGNQTFGITSGTSNCEVGEMGQTAALFMEVNKEIVMKDASRGQGESLEALASIFHCKDQAVFGEKMQSNFGRIFGHDGNTYESTRRILNTIKTDAQLSATCTPVS